MKIDYLTASQREQLKITVLEDVLGHRTYKMYVGLKKGKKLRLL